MYKRKLQNGQEASRRSNKNPALQSFLLFELEIISAINKGHPINERDNLNWLPIHEACNYGHLELVDLLVKNGAKINDLLGPITPLHDVRTLLHSVNL